MLNVIDCITDRLEKLQILSGDPECVTDSVDLSGLRVLSFRGPIFVRDHRSQHVPQRGVELAQQVGDDVGCRFKAQVAAKEAGTTTDK